MKDKIYKIEDNNLIITVPLKTRRFNPYNDMAGEDPDTGEMSNIIGLYENDYTNGLCYTIDMDYKGKDDQWSDYFFRLDGTHEEFEEMCKYLKISYVEL